VITRARFRGPLSIGGGERVGEGAGFTQAFGAAWSLNSKGLNVRHAR